MLASITTAREQRMAAADDQSPKPPEDARAVSGAGASYDATPYPRMAHQDTHPMHLCVLGTLMGMEPARPTRCRVLDIGCAMGTNLLPMAMAYPESEFVGIDASAHQIALGNADIANLGVANVTLIAADILALDTSDEGPLGKFDYITAHGFYSWVPPHVADALLAVIKRLLAPQGVAFVSYNVYPGWYQMEGLRRIMLYRIRSAATPAERIEQAREVLRFVAHTNPADESPFGMWVNGYQEYIDAGDTFSTAERDAYMLHDQLEQDNHPAFFHEFNAHARGHGLQYVCDAEIHHDFPQGLPEGSLDFLRKMVQSVDDMQQYMDFARNRMFRRTLLAHDDVELSRVLRPERLATMRFSSPMIPVRETETIAGPDAVTFVNQAGLKVTTDHPFSKAALQCLTVQWPRTFSLDELVECARLSLPARVTEQDVLGLCVTLMQGFTSGRNVVMIHADPPAYTPQVSERPVGAPWARYDLQQGPVVTSQRHERVHLDMLEAEILGLLDGTRTVEDLVGIFLPHVRRGEITFADVDTASLDDDALHARLTDLVAKRVDSLCKAAMLVG
jgi:methyltransferase-like protein/SAM-dependent methyltransferase